MPKRPIRIEDLTRFRHVSEPRIHPDGSRILYSLKELGEKNKNRIHLFTVDLFDQTVKQWTFGEGSNSSGMWSPLGTEIAFVSKRAEGGPQIHLMPTDGGEARPLTKLPEGAIGSMRYSPNGKKIAYLFRETHPDFTQAAAEARKSSGANTPPVTISSLHYRMDGDGYFGDQRYGVYVTDVQTGETTRLYDQAKQDFYSFDWTADSTALIVSHPIFAHNPATDVSNDLMVRVDLNGKFNPISGLPIGEKGSIRCSPDGEWVAYIGYASEEDERGEINRRLFIFPTKGGEARCLTQDDDVCLAVGVNSDTKSDDGTQLQWSPDSQALYLQVAERGSMELGYVPIDEGGIQRLTQGNHLVYLGNLSQDGEKIACTYANATRLQEIAVYDLSKHPEQPTVLTNVNHALYDEVNIASPEEIWLDTVDGTKVHAWVIKPEGFASKNKYPAVLEVHGGPHMMYGNSFMHEFQVLAAQGYFVVYSNPKGSKGYGEAHTAAIRNSWGVKDWEDIQTVLHWMQHHPNIQAGRIGIMGGSYGGYMTNWAIGHTNEFKAAITDRCVSNLVSKAGNSDYLWRPNGYWQGYAYGGWDKIKVLWNQSPIAYFENVKTPTLVIHSEGDLRCNIEQGEQVFAALQQRGVESRFVRYPANTSHGMSRGGPADLRMHRLNEIVNWWHKHL